MVVREGLLEKVAFEKSLTGDERGSTEALRSECDQCVQGTLGRLRGRGAEVRGDGGERECRTPWATVRALNITSQNEVSKLQIKM